MKKIIRLTMCLLAVVSFIGTGRALAVDDDKSTELNSNEINLALEERLLPTPEVLVPSDPGGGGNIYDGYVWKSSTKVWDGKVGYYITNYQWLSNGYMIGPGIIATANRKAVISKYGSVSSKYLYRMKTKQHITKTAVLTQGYMTVSADAVCYERKLK